MSILIILLSLLGILVFMSLLAAAGWIWTKRDKIPLCPYTNTPLRLANTLKYTTIHKVNQYQKRVQNYDNRIFDINYAAFSRETGRIFSNCVKWNGSIALDWTFLQKKHPGNWVSWGSLSQDVQRELWEKHGTIVGFQTESSSANPSPREVEEKYAFAKPGPLYVDLESGTLLGWVIVPDTEVEILILKKVPETY